MIYLDNAATTRPCAEAVAAVTDTMQSCFGNASSLHRLGLNSEKVISSARKTLLAKLGEGEIYFTSGATESNNTAIFGAVETYRRNGDKIVTTAMEHPAAANPIAKLEERGMRVVRLSPKDHEDFEQAVADAVDDRTLLVSCMAVNNETGYAVDVKRLYRLVKRKNEKTIVHIDAVQGFLKVPLDGDFISISGHKIHGPKGIGALYVKKGVRFAPLLLGGGQQKKLRSGTEPVELIAGLEAAVKNYRGKTERFSQLKSHLVSALSELDGIKFNSTDKCVPNIVNFSIKGVRSEIMLHSLEQQEIYVSSGSACSKGKTSGVLAAFGVPDSDADSAIRVSMCADTTEEELDILVDNIRKGIERFRR
ncbi:MAG: cysteine desulfurase [Oscillospiraceae bacterium]|nr:cysteine desulfurase [Oscillospiraceae bacterium]